MTQIVVNIEKLFHSLEGYWSIEREVSSFGFMRGVAQFARTADPAVLHYYEELRFKNSHGQESNAYQEYLYCLQNEEISVFFAKQQNPLLVALNFKKGSSYPLMAWGRHECACLNDPTQHDVYEASYRFVDQENFSITYQVDGPKKHYRTYSVFREERSLTCRHRQGCSKGFISAL